MPIDTHAPIFSGHGLDMVNYFVLGQNPFYTIKMSKIIKFGSRTTALFLCGYAELKLTSIIAVTHSQLHIMLCEAK